MLTHLSDYPICPKSTTRLDKLRSHHTVCMLIDVEKYEQDETAFSDFEHAYFRVDWDVFVETLVVLCCGQS